MLAALRRAYLHQRDERWPRLLARRFLGKPHAELDRRSIYVLPTGFGLAYAGVAGALALLMSADPSLSARQAADRLAATAIADLSFAEAADPGLGAGRARLPPPGPLQPTGCLDRMAGPFALMFPLFRWRRRQGTMRRHAGASAAPNSPSPPEPR